MHPLTRSCFLLLVLERLFLLALSFLLRIFLCSRWSPPFPLYALALIPLSFAHLDSLTPHDLVLWTDGSVSFPFGKGGSGVLANCSLCGTEATLSFSAGPVRSSFSAEACAIVHALCGSRQHQQICHFSCLLLLSDSRSVLSSIISLISNSVADLAGTVFSLLLFYQATMGPRTLVSPGERCFHLPQPLVVSLLLSLVSTLVFSWTGGVLSLPNFLTHRFPRFPLRNLCSLVMLAVSSLVYAATDTAFF